MIGISLLSVNVLFFWTFRCCAKKMEADFEEANDRNLPEVDADMVDNFYRRNADFFAHGVRNVKTSRSSKQIYGDEAIGFVQVKRDKTLCTVKAKVTPEHKVRSTPYAATVIIDENKEEVVSCTCADCAARSGGCKHSVALLYWLLNKTCNPSVTSTDCYWKKSALAKVGTSLKGQTLQEIFKIKSSTTELTGCDFKDKVVESGRKENSDGILFSFYSDKETDAQKISLHRLFMKYTAETNTEVTADNFIKYCSNHLSEETCEKVANLTKDQSDCKEWFDVRFARITASKLHEVAQCTTYEGATTHAVLGASKFKSTRAMERGKSLEDEVLQVIAKKRKMKIEKTGIIIKKEFPVFGASPDGITKDYCVEIKCPMKEKTVENYIKNGNVTTKPYAQLQLQMYLSGREKGLFCVASPHFETNKEVTILDVMLNKSFCEKLMQKALDFWKKAVFPILNT